MKDLLGKMSKSQVQSTVDQIIEAPVTIEASLPTITSELTIASSSTETANASIPFVLTAASKPSTQISHISTVVKCRPTTPLHLNDKEYALEVCLSQ